MENSIAELLVSRVGHLGKIRLNRPKALNSLTIGMVRSFASALDEFGEDASIAAVLVTGAGERGLCAGGDIRALYELRSGDRGLFTGFWRKEYELNARIASFPKPYIVLMDGIVMGGGVGISAHGNRRIVTERTRLAMPETGIGFIPDVGGSWLLTRDGGAGLYIALSGAMVSGADALHLGIADLMIDSSDIRDLEERLEAVEESKDVDSLLTSLARTETMGVLEQNKELLNAAMAHDRVEETIAALAADLSLFARRATAELGKKSPTSLRLTHELLKRGTKASRLEACLINEFRVACRLLESYDLFEGIRAAVVDKDRNPHWRPATLGEVQDKTIAAMLEGSGVADPVFLPWRESSYARLPASTPRGSTEEGLR